MFFLKACRCTSCRAVLAVILIASCKADLKGENPAITSLDPNLLCIEQITTEVVLSGEAFMPIVVKSLVPEKQRWSSRG